MTTKSGRRRKKLGEILVDQGVLDQDQLDRALKHMTQHRLRLGEALIDLKVCNDEAVTKALAVQYGMPFYSIDEHPIPKESMQLLPEEFIRRTAVLPLSRENGRLQVILSDPLDLDVLDEIRFRQKLEVEPLLAPRSRILQYIDRVFDNQSTARQVEETMQTMTQTDIDIKTELDDDDDDEESEDAPIIRFCRLLLSEAVKQRASDVHVEPMGDRVRVRYRIDGECIERDAVPKKMQASVIARLKIMAGLDIAERRLPQDGRIKMEINDKQVDFRVSTLPAYHGESVVMRILNPDSARKSINEMGFAEDDFQKLQKMMKRPNGIFLVTGPTGSGKTTTLYAMLNELNRPDKKIITAEDPVEYNFTGINQCQVREHIGLTFAKVLRAMLRQAPNIVLVGEIRDKEVADVAIQAALTGHLVFSTLHTNDAPGSITRLIDVGVAPFLVASSVQGVLAQRLVRSICSDCKEIDPEPDKFALKALGIDEKTLAETPIYRGGGCQKCNGTGFRGRRGIFEFMVMNNELRELAFKRATTSQIRKAARAGGMKTLVEDGIRKVLMGITTPVEVMKLAQQETLVTD
jgi:type IV pilus assembly protein PilB